MGNPTVAVFERKDGAVFELAHIQDEMLHVLWLIGKEWLPEEDPRVHDIFRDAIEDIRLNGLRSASRRRPEFLRLVGSTI